MAKGGTFIDYSGKTLSAEYLDMIRKANRVVDAYRRQGFNLTLRQLYYYFVSHDLFPDDQTWTQNPATGKWFRDPNGTKNAPPNYKWLGDIISDGRMAGLVDWLAIIDRTRDLETLPHWDGPEDIVEAISQQFRYDRWASQPNRVEVWIEKDALVGVIEGVCKELDLPYFSCRGYTSLSSMWQAAQRLRGYEKNGQPPVILHFGDHDPSGKDMTRDIEDRMATFGVKALDVRRLALNWDQIEQYSPPPNPAKVTDPRAKKYIEEFGDESWELDALEPAAIATLIRGELETLIDQDAWTDEETKQADARATLTKISERFEDVKEFVDE